jgi:hypothetical protein
VIRLIIHGLLPSQNRRERAHWRARRRQEKSWDLSIRCQVSVEDTTTSRRRAVKVISYRRQRITDCANLVGGAKGLIDCLVRAGLLVDDSDRWCSISYHQRLRSHADNPDHGRDCIVVEVEDAPC